ncbi:hypothetical protein OG864_05560 [Streptomyces sp. NBC_00124]|uniref:hypothetical protein n=1 Tax=Streptomyces sp. NBC_00124 TaxID=2975662 RepID=UPI0022594577|nr:hypothetical protein [Streptomyces sp. NBC_00124]MCX5358161.1 hypothetical protein [Streptomyces sp. NBC_00124]
MLTSAQLFGLVPTAEDTLARYTDELRTAQHRCKARVPSLAARRPDQDASGLFLLVENHSTPVPVESNG